MTQAKLAKILDRNQSFVAKYEGGERRLDVVEFIDVALAIGEDPASIISSIMSGGVTPQGRNRKRRKTRKSP